MIGKAEWFARRKYSGWGIVPKTWQGWAYIAIVILPLMVFQSLPFWSTELRMAVTIAWMIFLAIDVTDIMIRMKKDERERMHEAISERNAAWFMVLVCAAGTLYYSVKHGLQEELYFEPFMITAVLGGLAIKALSNYYLERRR